MEREHCFPLMSCVHLFLYLPPSLPLWSVPTHNHTPQAFFCICLTLFVLFPSKKQKKKISENKSESSDRSYWSHQQIRIWLLGWAKKNIWTIDISKLKFSKLFVAMGPALIFPSVSAYSTSCHNVQTWSSHYYFPSMFTATTYLMFSPSRSSWHFQNVKC